MKRNLVLCLLLFNPIIACNGPTPAKKVDVIQIDKINRDTDILAGYPELHFIGSGFEEFDFYDERYMRFYDLPVTHMDFKVEDNIHIHRISLDLQKKKEDVKTLKDKLTKIYGQPGEDSSNDFSTSDNIDLLVWKNDHQLIGLAVEKGMDTLTKMEREPNVSIVFVKPEDTTQY